MEIQNESVALPVIGNGESGASVQPVVVRFLPTLACPGTVELLFTVEDSVKGGRFTFTESLPIGATNQQVFYEEDFDTPPPQPDYVTDTISGTVPWVYSAGKVQHSGDSAARDGRLITNELTKGGAAVLEFQHSFAFSPQVDGAILEMRENEAAQWMQVSDLKFSTGDYNSVVGFTFPHPFGQVNAWTGFSSNVVSRVDISDFPATFFVSFRLASVGGSTTSWSIDSVKLLGPGQLECDPVYIGPTPVPITDMWILSDAASNPAQTTSQ